MIKKNEVWTVGSILKWTGQYFQEKGVESPRVDAEVLLSHVLGKERIYLYVHFDEPLQADELKLYKEFIKRRVMHQPVAYILGYKEFMGLRFKVSPAVLIPRPDTEILVEAVIERLKKYENINFLDIGTGSGAIALAVLHNILLAKAIAVDLSADALAVAKENADSLQLTERVTFCQGDLYEPISNQQFTAIISNPPYIPDSDIATLQAEVRQEPIGALAGGSDGLDFYRRLIKDGISLLKPGGFMAFEVGIYQADAVGQLCIDGGLTNLTILNDYGSIERVVIAYKQELS